MNFLFYFIFILVPLSEAAHECPQSCECVADPVLPSALTVSCSFSVFPQRLSVPPGSRTLHVSCTGDSPSDLSPGLFADVPALHSFSIQGCRLRALSANSFSNFSTLRGLHLENVASPDTSIALPEDVFSRLSKLEKLHFTGGGVESLPAKMFCHMPHLMVLNVSQNLLSELSFDPSCPSKLIIADLSFNRISSLAASSLQFLPSVRQLSLSHNQINFVHGKALLHLALLQQLDLEANRVDGLPTLPATLIHVNLARNELRAVPKSVAELPKLVSLNVSHNGILFDTPFPLHSVELETMDMSYNRLSDLPLSFLSASSASLVHLHVDHNRIADIGTRRLSNYSRLQTLSMCSNGLSVLRDGAFSALLDLSTLSLRNNSLEVVENGAFTDLTITELDVSSNRFTEVPLAVGSLLKLRKVDLSHNRISKLFMTVFNRSPHLHSVDLSNNELQTIPSYVFSDCPHLAVLDLSANRINAVLKDAFVKCPLLRRIDLSRNRLSAVEESLRGAEALRRLNLTHNQIEILKWESLPDRLETLQADDNRIALLAAGIRSSVRFASLRNNLIEQLSADQLPNTLESIDLSSNRIRSIAKGTLMSKSSLREIRLERNSLESLNIDALAASEAVHPLEISLRDNPLKCSCELDWIGDKSKRKVLLVDGAESFCRHAIDNRKVSLSSVEGKELLCPYERVCEPGCICCQFGSCDCRSVCPDGCRCFRDSTFSTNIVRCEGSNRTASRPFSPRDIPMQATHVYISGIQLPVLKSHSFLGRHKLLHLHLNRSGLSDIQPNAFNTLTNLQLLDLSDNGLEKLSGEELHKTSNVTHLFLNGNRLRFLESAVLQKLPRLQMITLHNNLLSTLSASISTSALFSMSLSSNPFRCDCGDRFLAPKWIHENRDRIADYSRVFCVENVTRAFRENDTTVLSAFPPNVGDDVFTMPVDDFVREANRSICVPFPTGLFGSEPSSSMLLLLLLAAVVLLLLGLLALGIAFARRTHSAMSQRRYKASSSLNCSSTTPGSSPLPLPLISFDAFVSYAKRDEKMVVEQICRPLEEDDYHLCLLHRDGPVYNVKVHSISDELIHQMDSASCLILVLTQHFLDNEWKTLQIKTSHQLFARNRSKRVIAVLGEGVDPNLLDDELGGMLRKSERIYMRDHLFWNLLRAKLPLRSPPGNSSGGSQIYSDLYGPVPSEMV